MNRLNYKIFMLLGYIKAKIEDLSQRSLSYGPTANAAVIEFESYFNKEISSIFKELDYDD